MTGRRGRVITKEDTGKVQYELRNADSDAPVECMNMEEKEKFMNGEKLVAIISEAASSGISLQVFYFNFFTYLFVYIKMRKIF